MWVELIYGLEGVTKEREGHVIRHNSISYTTGREYRGE